MLMMVAPASNTLPTAFISPRRSQFERKSGASTSHVMKATDGAIVGTLACFVRGSVEALAACERFMVRGGASRCEAGRAALASLLAEQLWAPLWTGRSALVPLAGRRGAALASTLAVKEPTDGQPSGGVLGLDLAEWLWDFSNLYCLALCPS